MIVVMLRLLICMKGALHLKLGWWKAKAGIIATMVVAAMVVVALAVCVKVTGPNAVQGDSAVAATSTQDDGANGSSGGETSDADFEIVRDEAGHDMMAHELIVAFDKNANEQQARESIEALGYEVDETLASANDETGRTVLVKLPLDVEVEDAVALLNEQPGVGYAEPDYVAELVDDASTIDASASAVAEAFCSMVDASASIVANATSDEVGDEQEAQLASSVNDTYASQQWALDAMGVYDAWDVARCEKAVSVAVIDAGANTDHEDLAGNIVATYNAATQDDFADNSANHGTHVSGIVAAKANNGKGVAGVSYNAGIVAIDASYCDSGGKEHITVSAIVKGYQYLIENASKYNIRVVNMSLAGSGTISTSLSEQIDLAEEKGIVTVCAAGNSSSSLTPPCAAWPGDYEKCVNVINLRGTKNSSGQWTYTRSNSSNYGEGKNISAPGMDIYSTTSSTGSVRYATKSGTSMASPQVAGIAALMFAANPSLTAEQCKSILYSTATDLGTAGFDTGYGWGAVNAFAAVHMAKAGTTSHAYASLVTAEATCTEPGNIRYTCTGCGHYYDEPIAATGHSYAVSATVEPTCAQPGYTRYTCSKCGDSYDEPIPASGHTPGEWQTLQVATLGHAGSEEQRCTECKTLLDTREVPQLAGFVRLTGSTRYDTAAAIASEYRDGGTCEFAIVASGDNFPDALAASYAAGMLNAPIMLTNPNSLSQQTLEQIEESEASHIVVIGGDAAVSANVASQLESIDGVSEVMRIAGGTRFETAEEIYKQVGSMVDDGTGVTDTAPDTDIPASTVTASRTAIVANAYAFPDALCASPIAYAEHSPIFLASGDSLQQSTASILTSGSFDEVLIVGGSAAVSGQIEEHLEDAGLEVTRLSGESRYDTSAAIANYALQQGTLTTQSMGVASGGNFPDALAGAALCGKNKSVLLLANPNDGGDNSVLATFVRGHRLGIEKLYIFGGDAAVPASVEELLRGL